MGRRTRAYIGLGANLGDAEATLAAAVAALGPCPGSGSGVSLGCTPPSRSG